MIPDFQEVGANQGLIENVEQRLSGGYYHVGVYVPEDKRTLEKSFLYLLELGVSFPEKFQKIYGASVPAKYELQGTIYSSKVFVYGLNSDLANSRWCALVLESSLYGDWMVLFEQFTS